MKILAFSIADYLINVKWTLNGMCPSMFEAAAVFARLTFPSVVLTLPMLLAPMESTVVPVMLVDDGVMIDQVTVDDDLLLHDGEIIQVGIEEELLLDNVVFIVVDILVATKLFLRESAVTFWLEHSTPERAVWV